MHVQSRGMGETNWLDVINTSVKTGMDIIKTRFAVPQLNPGQYIQTQQGIQYQLNPNQSSFQTIPGLNTQGSSLIIWAVLGLGGLVVVSKLLGGK